MLLALLDAIKVKFAATSALTSGFAGGLYTAHRGKIATFPALVVTPISGEIVDSYGNVISSNNTIQFMAIGVGMRAVGALARVATGAFDNVVLDLTPNSKTQIGLFRLTEPFPIIQPEGEPAKTSDGSDVWAWPWSYVYSVQ